VKKSRIKKKEVYFKYALLFNIILKDGTQILKEGDSCKYFIYKTDKNIYIYNEYIEEVEKYSNMVFSLAIRNSSVSFRLAIEAPL